MKKSIIASLLAFTAFTSYNAQATSQAVPDNTVMFGTAYTQQMDTFVRLKAFGIAIDKSEEVEHSFALACIYESQNLGMYNADGRLPIVQRNHLFTLMADSYDTGAEWITYNGAEYKVSDVDNAMALMLSVCKVQQGAK